jgi:hypothetical protein
VLSFPLRTLGGESALLCVGAVMQPEDWARQVQLLQRDFQILGNYFHQHIMRIYGHDTATMRRPRYSCPRGSSIA